MTYMHIKQEVFGGAQSFVTTVNEYLEKLEKDNQQVVKMNSGNMDKDGRQWVDIWSAKKEPGTPPPDIQF